MTPVDKLLAELRSCVAEGAGRLRRVDSGRFEERLTAVQRVVEAAQHAVNDLVRTQVAQGLAPAFLERRHPYEQSEALTTLMREGWLHRASFLQKSPQLLDFYRRLLRGMDSEPERILEIGVKGGGSTAFWKAVFPSATVLGLDINIRRWLKSDPSPDGVIYVECDQADPSALRRIADLYGPFNLVIDDGSHVGEHQAVSLRTLLPHVSGCGYYVIEDVQTTVKPCSTRPVDFGSDPWGDFTLTVLQRLRGGPLPPASRGSELGRDLVRHIDDLIVTSQVLAIRARKANPG